MKDVDNTLEMQLKLLQQMLSSAQLENKELLLTNSRQTELIADLITQITTLNDQLSKAISQLNKLNKKVYGSMSEKRHKNKKDNNKDNNNNSSSSTDNSTLNNTSSEDKRKGFKPDKKAYDGLEEVTIELEPEEKSDSMRFISYDKVCRLKYIPGRFIKEIYILKTYGDGDKIYRAQLPDNLMPRCSADTSLISLILSNKYAYHLPIERSLKMLSAMGVDLPKSSVMSWIKRGVQMLAPLQEQMKKEILKATYLNIDETTTRTIIKNGRKSSYIWGALSPELKAALFNYKDGSRGSKVLEEMIDQEKYKGVIQSDGYVVYEKFANESKGKIKRLSCMAHIRRKAIEALGFDTQMLDALQMIDNIYELERTYFNPKKKIPPEQVLTYRRELSFPIYKQLYRFIQQLLKKKSIKPGSDLKSALEYICNELRYQIPVFRDGSYRIDNNKAESLMRGPVIGRKNYSFCFNHEGGKRHAIMYTLIESCKLNKIDPYRYLKDILDRINNQCAQKLDELLPNKWKPILEYAI